MRASVAQTEPSLILLLTTGKAVETVELPLNSVRRVNHCHVAGNDETDRFLSLIYQEGHSVNLLHLSRLCGSSNAATASKSKRKWQRLKHASKLTGLIWHSSAEQFISSTADGIHRLWMFNESLFTNQLAINTYEWLCYHPKPLPVPQELESIPRFYRKTLASNLSTLHWLDCHSMRRLCPKKHASLTAEIFHYYAEILFAVLSDGTLVFWGIQGNPSAKRQSPRLLAISCNSRLFDYQQSLIFAHDSKSFFRNSCYDLAPELFPASVAHLQIDTELESTDYAVDIRWMSPTYANNPIPVPCKTRYLHPARIIASKVCGTCLLTVYDKLDNGIEERIASWWELISNERYLSQDPERKLLLRCDFVAGRIFPLNHERILMGNDLYRLKDKNLYRIKVISDYLPPVLDACVVGDTEAIILFEDSSVFIINFMDLNGENSFPQSIGRVDGAIRLAPLIDGIFIALTKDARLLLLSRDSLEIVQTSQIGAKYEQILQFAIKDGWMLIVTRNSIGEISLLCYSVHRLSQKIYRVMEHHFEEKERFVSADLITIFPDRPLLLISLSNRTVLAIPQASKPLVICEFQHERGSRLISSHLLENGSIVYVYDDRIRHHNQLCAKRPRYCPTVPYLASISAGPLPDCNPSLLDHWMIWGEFPRARTALIRLAEYFSLNDDHSIFPSIPLAALLKLKDESATVETSTEDLFTASTNMVDISSNKLTDELLGVLKLKLDVENLEIFPIGGPVINHKRLLAAVKTLTDVDLKRGALDINAIRFLVAFNSHHLASGPNMQPLNFKHYFWAYHSDSQSPLLDACVESLGKTGFGWKELRPIGPAFWIRSLDALKQLVETMARNQYLQTDAHNPAARSPTESGLFYVALGKKKALLALWKTSTAHSEHAKMVKFLSNDFSEERWKIAATKNAFALLGLQRFREAATFFLLAGSLWDAVQVCVKQMEDIQLAFLIARLYLNDAGLFEDKKAILHGILPKDIKSDDYIRRILWEHALYKSRETNDRWMVALVFCWLQSSWESFLSVFTDDAASEEWRPVDPDLFLAYKILLDKIEKRKLIPPQKLTGSTSSEFINWRRQTITKQIQFIYSIVAGMGNNGFHVSLLSLLDQITELISSAQFTQIYCRSTAVNRENIKRSLLFTNNALATGVVNLSDFSQAGRKETAQSLFDDEEVYPAHRLFEDDDDDESFAPQKSISLFGGPHEPLLDGMDEEWIMQTVDDEVVEQVNSAVTRIQAYKRQVAMQLLPSIVNNCIANRINSPAFKSLVAFAKDFDGIGESLELIRRFAGWKTEDMDLYMYHILSKFSFPLPIFTTNGQELIVDLALFRHSLCDIVKNVLDFDYELDRSHYFYVDLIGRRLFGKETKKREFIDMGMLIYFIVTISAIREKKYERILIAFQEHRDFLSALIDSNKSPDQSSIIDRLFGRLIARDLPKLTDAEQTIEEFELEHNQATVQLLQISLSLACYELAIQLLQKWSGHINHMEPLAFAEQFGRPLARQIERLTVEWNDLLNDLNPRPLKMNPIELLPGIDQRTLWCWLTQNPYSLEMHRFFERRDRLVIIKGVDSASADLGKTQQAAANKSSIPKFWQRFTSQNSKSMPVISL